MKNKICIADYGCGNTRSIQNSIKFIGYKSIISNKTKDIEESSHIILPGVGSFSNALDKIRLNLNLKNLKKLVFENNKPILGICVGMQALSTYGYEFNKSKGLGWIDGEVRKMKNKPNIIPQIGWNNLLIHSKNNKLFENIGSQDFFYFVHSFKFNVKNKQEVLASTEYNEKFTSVVNNKNIVGVQFHPEKSQSSGLKLLKNFIENFK